MLTMFRFKHSSGSFFFSNLSVSIDPFLQRHAIFLGGQTKLLSVFNGDCLRQPDLYEHSFIILDNFS